MASVAQIAKLRRKLNDFYAKDGTALTSDQYAFQDNELDELIDDAFLEVTDGARASDAGVGDDESLAILIARADGLLMLAQDEARRLKWEINNKIVDGTSVSGNLTKIASELRQRYEANRRRKLDEEKAGLTQSRVGKRMDFNHTVKSHAERNFNNRSVSRNRQSDHNL